MQTRLFQKVMVDNRGEVLVVGKVFCKDHECNGNISNRNRADVTRVVRKRLEAAVKRGEEGEVGECDKGLDAHAAVNKCLKGGEADDLHRFHICRSSDQGQNQRQRIAAEDTDDKGDELELLGAVGGHQHGNEQRHQTAENRKVADRVSRARGIGAQLGDCVTRKRQTDDCNGRTNDNRRHQLGNPLDTDFFHNQCDDNIHKSGKNRTEDQSEITERHGNAARKCRRH